jgi:hypothetical protein
MQISEKKVYPSQENTKAIACRIPITDYVKFINEAVNMGINLNDWLLTKIYKDETPGPKSINGVKEENTQQIKVKITAKELIDASINGDDENNLEVRRMHLKFIRYVISDNKIKSENDIAFNEIDESEFFRMASGYLAHSYKIWYDNENKIANLDDVKAQLTVLITNKFDSVKDRKEYRQELMGLLKELE